jgi:hypothetical protein
VLEFPEIPGLLALAITAVLGFRFMVFRASCALADAGETGAGRSILLVIGVLVLCAGFGLLPGYLFPPVPEDAGVRRFVACAAALLVAAPVAAVAYAWLLPTTLRRGIVVAGVELLLGTLLAALIVGVVLVVLAGFQLARRPQPPRMPASVSRVIRSGTA